MWPPLGEEERRGEEGRAAGLTCSGTSPAGITVRQETLGPACA